MNKEIIKTTDKNGVEREAEVVLCFESEETGKKYVIYTFNETDETGMIALYSSVVDESSEQPTFKNIDTEEEWTMIKNIMKKIVVDWKE